MEQAKEAKHELLSFLGSSMTGRRHILLMENIGKVKLGPVNVELSFSQGSEFHLIFVPLHPCTHQDSKHNSLHRLMVNLELSFAPFSASLDVRSSMIGQGGTIPRRLHSPEMRGNRSARKANVRR